MGSLCKLLAGKIASSSQNAFLERRQNLDVMLFVKESIDSLI